MKFTNGRTVRPWRFYALALLLYGPALFSKTTASTLPAAMLLVLWLRNEPIGWRRFVQTVPFLCYGIGIGLLSVWCEAHLGNYDEALRYSYSGVGRLLIATHALWFYAAKLLWPTQLTFIYPRWDINPRDPRQYVWLIACVAVALLLWWRRQAIGRGPLAAVVFFVAALSPLLGFIPVYTFRYSFVADHYQYVASIGLIALAAALAARAAVALRAPRVYHGVAAGALVALGMLTWRQAHVYQDVLTLWGDTLMKNPRCWMAHNNLAAALVSLGRVQEAKEHYEQSLQINPKNAEAHYNFGNALMRSGRIPEAIEEFQQALRIKPDDAEVHSNLGAALAKTGKIKDAIAHYEQALRIEPDLAEAHNNLGLVLARVGKSEDAIQQYQEALRLQPDNAEVHKNLGVALAQVGRVPEAIVQYEQALRIKPDFPQAQNALARLRAGQ
jgi:protein O-mannosyl-transferase